MRAVDIIVRKRDGAELTTEEIEFFIEGYANGSIPDYQAAAWAMAIYFQGMSDAEATALTLAMLHSGQQFDPHELFPPGAVIVDKHSTGGVGDKTTLALAPLVASLGLPVGKLSGRGLGFSGGTIDKLESIAGFNVDISSEQFMRQLHEIGLVMGSQTAELAPADGKLYALRDVTGTVPVLPLIASSIMSKKLASGADAIVLDVKVGQGAFMHRPRGRVAPGAADGGDWTQRRPPHGRRDQRHGPAAGPGRGQRAGAEGGHRHPARPRPRGLHPVGGDAGRRDAAAGRPARDARGAASAGQAHS